MNNSKQKDVSQEIREVLNQPGIDGKPFTIVLKKEWFMNDYINYEYQEEDGIFIRVESSPEEKERKLDEFIKGLYTPTQLPAGPCFSEEDPKVTRRRTEQLN